MAETDKKKLKLNVKNTQIAEALQLGKLKEKLAKNKLKSEKEENKDKTSVSPNEDKIALQKRKARVKSAFSEKKEEEEGEMTSPLQPKIKARSAPRTSTTPPPHVTPVREVLGPTGRHINDILPPKPIKKPAPEKPKEKEQSEKTAPPLADKAKVKEFSSSKATSEFSSSKTAQKKFKEFKDLRSAKKTYVPSRFDSRDRQGLRDSDDGKTWRKKRSKPQKNPNEDTTIRPSELSIRLPTSVKDLASEMKLKASQLISKLFLQGQVLTINDLLTDETTVQFLGEEFGCTITIDTTEEERIRITDQTIQEEIATTEASKLKRRAPAVAFMGHVDHGKTSLIDYIRQSNVAAGEAGAITQHIGAFLCKTDVGDIAILDTPGHEAFSEMRARGAEVTDIVVLVVAGDEGLKAQTIEAINHAKAAKVTIVVAINKCDKPNFNPDNVYRQLSEQDLLPEQWGGQTITVNCSAVTGEGINHLIEMLALQSEILELKANSSARARGTVIESERQKGMGSVATLFVQNGTLRPNDAIVFEEEWGRVKTMKNEQGHDLKEAGPSTPVEITGLSGLPKAGQEFIVVSSEKEARQISEARKLEQRDKHLQQSRKMSLENLLQEAGDTERKVLKIILRADMQGSLEALKAALLKIESEKAKVEIISTGIGEVSESDVLLASASKAIIVGFHTQVESHADELVKLHNVVVSLHNIIYHVVDEIRLMMTGLLDKLPQENESGKAEVREIFKSSQLGLIAGCIITDGTIHRNDYARLMRDGKEIWKGSIASLKRFKEDVKEVSKGIECGILLSKFSDYQIGDTIEAYTISYIDQEL